MSLNPTCRVLAAALTAAIGLSVAAVAADQTPPKQIWEVTGLENPESALPDPASKTIYVSNVNGGPLDKNGEGYLSKVSLEGQVTKQKWVEGLDAPKGMAKVDDTLYVADIDQLVAVDVATGKITKRYPAEEAVFLNDVAADTSGAVYVSDMATNKIWRLRDDTFEVFVDDAALNNPNGLLVEGENLLVASWGPLDGDAAKTVNGTMLSVDMKTKKISAVAGDTPEGNLDGLEPLGSGRYVVSDWVAGKVFTFGSDQKSEVLLSLEQGAADVGFASESKTLYVPRMKENTLRAYQLP